MGILNLVGAIIGGTAKVAAKSAGAVAGGAAKVTYGAAKGTVKAAGHVAKVPFKAMGDRR